MGEVFRALDIAVRRHVVPNQMDEVRPRLAARYE
jgi:hypothetical protein